MTSACTTTPDGSSSTESSTTPSTDDSATGADTQADTDLPTADGTGSDFPPPVLDDCIDDGSAGMHVYTCEGFDYDVTIPEACLQTACGVIVDVHGLSMSAQMQEANTSIAAQGSARGYIVVQPNANPDPPVASWNPPGDDALVVDFMLRVADAFHADPDRLHFTGFSQGGFMSWRVLCEYADLLASVAPAAACGDGSSIVDCNFEGDAQPDVPVDVLYLHGTTDVLVPHACAPVRQAAVVAAYDLGPEQVVTQGDGYTWVRHQGDDGTVLEVITHEYNADNVAVLGGHCYPGSDDPGDAPGQLFSFACVEPTDLHWGQAVLDFFDAHPRG